MADDKGKWELDKEFDLDMSLDDIEDLPGFSVFPTGSYLVVVPESFSEKKIGAEGKEQHPILECKMALKEIMELPPESLDREGDDGLPEVPPKPGDICTLAFMLDNKVGLDNLKKFLKPIAQRLGTAKVSEICRQSAELVLLVVVKRTYDEKKDRYYSRVKRVAVP